MSFIEIVLYPIIFLMRLVLETGYWLFSNYGLAIIFLSIVVTLVTQPLSRIATRIQEKENARQLQMQPEIVAAKAKYKGERQFNEIEAIYKKYNYHPIHSIKEIFGVLLQIPFLLSALVLLLSYQPLHGVAFGPIHDLAKPDALARLPDWFPVDHLNLLPILTALLSVGAGYFMPSMTRQSWWRSNIVSAAILVIIYRLPSAVVMYWTFNNAWSLLKSLPFAQSVRTTKS